MDYSALYNTFAMKYLGRHLDTEDAIDEQQIVMVELKLGIQFPDALRNYYKVAGKVEEFNRIHNKLFDVADIEIDGDYLVFMDENQSVVSWGIRLTELRNTDPVVWQRNNTPPTEWNSEEKSFTDFLQSMFDWYQDEDVWGGT